MNVLQMQMVREFQRRGGKVVVFDKDANMAPIILAIYAKRAERQLARMRRHGSRNVKVAVRRAARRYGASSFASSLVVASVHASVRMMRRGRERTALPDRQVVIRSRNP